MTMFSWLLKRFLGAFIILVAVQLVIYTTGLSLILSGYERNQLELYENAAGQILLQPDIAADIELPSNNPFFVFSADMELIYSNKGKGRSLSTEELRPVYSGTVVSGYYHAGETHFADTQSNRIFLISIIILSAFSILLSIVIGFLFAFYSSRRIVKPVGLLRTDIHDLRLVKPVPVRAFDISELADISTDLSDVSHILNSQEEYKRQWLRDLAHDLRTPLSGLKSQLEAMADGVLEPTPERFRRHLLEIERLENLASSIGELMSIESKKSVEKKSINADHFLTQLTTLYDIEMKHKNITLEKDVKITEIMGDEKLLLRGIGNIMANAVKYIDEGGLIHIEMKADDESSIISISNNGPDIPEAQRELIFTRLFRGDSARSTSGSGLGLAITREIISLHDGEVQVENLKPNGVRFIIILPSL